MAMVFPTIIGRNLHKKTTIIPDDFSTKNIIIIVAFQKWHQENVNKCIRSLENAGLNTTHDILEVPVIRSSSWLKQMRLDGLMRAAFRDPNIRQRTVTVYIDKQHFRNSLNIPDEESIHWFLVDYVDKNILLRGENQINTEDIEAIKSASKI